MNFAKSNIRISLSLSPGEPLIIDDRLVHVKTLKILGGAFLAVFSFAHEAWPWREVGLVETCAFVLMEHLHDDDVIVVLELVVDVVCRRAHVDWRGLAFHDDVDHERDGGRHVDVDEDDLHLHLFRAPKTCGLNVGTLKMMKGNKT